MIRFTNIYKRFGRLQALDNINLFFEEGKSIALIGPNGSGKTTLIKGLLGMVVPDKGDIAFKGVSVLGSCEYRGNIGYMPQISSYPENMTIAQVMEMMKDIRQYTTLDEDLVHAFKLPQLANKRMRTLSGGTRQKVSACLAFLFNPEVLVLDEPTAGLDPVASGILQDKILQETKNGKLVLITSHILSELDDLVDEVAYLQDGKVQFHKQVAELQAETGEQKLVRAIARVMENEGL
ncbi:ABC transporter ATP-binding protein [[Flexibacter] sp. ATCC 35208]|uniref:ABC transporter ATP-binding protein n=1 Tax=[Flexibacter] sp. ATCC 35208 TaxID=1936242 RepID=UPI0009C68A06|nr:ABC transporter ATP-binding protein [[Flexibacter] sp. ATCC 35208]OMP76734.1 copper ABC transporter ATP-binding protein [[Flexibacter] sp. ATCC 35208]